MFPMLKMNVKTIIRPMIELMIDVATIARGTARAALRTSSATWHAESAPVRIDSGGPRPIRHASPRLISPHPEAAENCVKTTAAFSRGPMTQTTTTTKQKPPTCNRNSTPSIHGSLFNTKRLLNIATMMVGIARHTTCHIFG